MAILDGINNAFQPGGALNNPEFDDKLINFLLNQGRPQNQPPSLMQQALQFAELFNKPMYQQPTQEQPSMLQNAWNTAKDVVTNQIPQAVKPTIDMLKKWAQDTFPGNPALQSVAMSQALLESGPNLSSSLARRNNFFGIKGKGAQYATTEYVNGQPVRQVEGFSTNQTPEASFRQYRRLIVDNPRYDAVEAAKTPQEAFHNLQKAGYATDPQYASKLNRIYQRYVAPMYQ